MATLATEKPSTPKEIDSTKPQAMAIPKEGYFELQKAGTAPSIHELQPAMDSPSSRRSNREEKTRSATYGKTIQGAMRRPFLCPRDA